METLLDGRTAVVTGGASGIGRRICLAFAAHGADVFVADRRRTPRGGGAPTDELVAAETDAAATHVECDVTDPDSLASVVERADAAGGLDAMVNNAGIFRTESFLEVAPDEFDEMMAVNVGGVFFGAQAAARRMVDGDGGVIVNISSGAARRGAADRVAYTGSKAAVEAMTYGMADCLGPEGVRVNAILPGLIETSMADWAFEADAVEEIEAGIPSRRLGEPSEIADAAVFLASEYASYVNGAALPVDGGSGST